MKARAPRRYVPKKNSAPYAILITLYRAVQTGKEYMMKQELIDAAEASGLSHMPIEPNKGVVPPRFGAGPQFTYSGWSSMKTLVDRSLVVKKNCPAKYMLTDEGKRTAEECLERSGMRSGENASQISPLKEACMGRNESQNQGNVRDEDPRGSCRRQIIQNDQPSLGAAAGSATTLDITKLQEMGFGEAQIHAATQKAAKVGVPESDLWGFMLGVLLGGKGDGTVTEKDNLSACPSNVQGRGASGTANGSLYHSASSAPMESVIPPSYAGPKVCTSARSENVPASTSGADNELAVPPLAVGESFGQAYDVILVLDSREQFCHNAKGSSSLHKFAERMCVQFQIRVEGLISATVTVVGEPVTLEGTWNQRLQTRQLPVGDALWLARHKQQEQEYVLDFLVERKRVDDLWSSIKDTRYKQQKLRIMRCGVRKLLYLVEGDPNLMDSAENLKTAMFTTEILEGFDVQRTRDTNETVQKYGELTHAITNRYSLEFGKPNTPPNAVCPTFVEFVEHCKDLDMERVSDVFGVQLMQVRNVTEDMALSILEHYPTVLSLATAYSNLEGDLTAQEKLLAGIPIRNKNKTISEKISRNIFKLIWAQ